MSYYRCTRCGDELPDGCDMHGCLARHEAMVDELTRLRAEVEALRADAERYRWLRHGDNDEPCLHFSADCKAGTDTVWLLRDDKLDAAIDAARAALNQETPK